MDFLIYLAIVPSMGFAAQWIAWRTGLPSILLLLLFGVLLGQLVQPDPFLADLMNGDPKSSPYLLFPLVTLAVAVIMFEGGLSLELRELRESGRAAFRLCTIGSLITWFGSTVAAHYTIGFGWRLSTLLGAILVVTGPTVIGPLLRHVRPSRRVASTLKWEGIVIDPIGAILAVLVFDQLMVVEQPSMLGAIAMLLETATCGVIAGIFGGLILTTAFRKYWVPDNLRGVCSLTVGLLFFAISDHFASESGLIAVTVIGIWLSNQRYFGVGHIIEFMENLRTLLIGCLFIVLGSRVNLSDVVQIGLPGLAFLTLLILLVRPLSVFMSLLGTSLSFREKAFISGLAPRGIVAAAVSSVFAIRMEPISESLSMPDASQLDTAVFLVIVGTVLVYGLAASPLAKRLGLAAEKSNGLLIIGSDNWVREFAKEIQKLDLPVMLVDTNYNKISKARVDGLEAVCGNILNEHVRDELTLAGIGHLMAMTPNDEINSLVVQESHTLFDRSRLYQLSFRPVNQHHRRGLPKNLMGRALFGESLTHSHIQHLCDRGAVFKTTNLTDAFDYQDFLKNNDSAVELLCLMDSHSNLIINSVDEPLSPKSGDRVIALVGPKDQGTGIEVNRNV